MLSQAFPDLPLWLPCFLLLVVLLYIYGTYPLRTWKKRGIRGPDPAPFFGNTSQLFNEKVGVCTNVQKWQEQYGRLIGVYFFMSPALIVTHKEALRQIFVKEFNNFSDRFLTAGGTLQQEFIKKGIFFADGAAWQRIRRIMTPAFSSGKLKLVVHHVNTAARRLADNLAACCQSGVHPGAKEIFGSFTIDVIAGTAFGLDLDSQHELRDTFTSRVKSMIKSDRSARLKLSIANIFPVIGKLFRWLNVGLFNSNDVSYFREQMNALIEEKKLYPELFKHQDFIQLLINSEADSSENIAGSKKLTHDEVAAQGLIFLIAGYETSSTALQYLAYEIARHQDVQSKLRDEILAVVGEDRDPTYDDCLRLKYTEAVINEVLRMYPPLHLITRQAVADTTLMGFHVPAKTAIYVPIFNIGHDPEYFDDPDTFNPDRFLGEKKAQMDAINFLPFGFGPRQCMGLRLAILQVKIGLVHMIRKVQVAGATPKTLDIEDYTALLIPREPIKLFLQRRQV